MMNNLMEAIAFPNYVTILTLGVSVILCCSSPVNAGEVKKVDEQKYPIYARKEFPWLPGFKCKDGKELVVTSKYGRTCREICPADWKQTKQFCIKDGTNFPLQKRIVAGYLKCAPGEVLGKRGGLVFAGELNTMACREQCPPGTTRQGDWCGGAPNSPVLAIQCGGRLDRINMVWKSDGKPCCPDGFDKINVGGYGMCARPLKKSQTQSMGKNSTKV